MVDWPCNIVKPSVDHSIDCMQNAFDSVLYIVAFIDSYVQHIPLVYSQSDINMLRINMCYSVLNSRMPT